MVALGVQRVQRSGGTGAQGRRRGGAGAAQGRRRGGAGAAQGCRGAEGGAATGSRDAGAQRAHLRMPQADKRVRAAHSKILACVLNVRKLEHWHHSPSARSERLGRAPLECVEQHSTGASIRGGRATRAVALPGGWSPSTGCCTWLAHPAVDRSSPRPRKYESPRPTWMVTGGGIGAPGRAPERHNRSLSSASKLYGEGALLRALS